MSKNYTSSLVTMKNNSVFRSIITTNILKALMTINAWMKHT